MSVLEECAKTIIFETLKAKFFNEITDEDDVAAAVEQELHDQLEIGWILAEALRKKLMPELWIKAEEYVTEANQSAQAAYEAASDALRSATYGH